MAVDHWTSAGIRPFDTVLEPDDSSVRYVLTVGPGESFLLEENVSYTVGQDLEDLADTAEADLMPVGQIFADGEAHYRDYWSTADMTLGEEKQRAFDFYDPITTGDSTLSSCVQGIMAAEVGYSDVALKHITEALFIDLDNTHSNTVDGMHIASTGGIWNSLVCGFAGMRDQCQVLHFDPRLPAEWDGLEGHVPWSGVNLGF